MRERETSIALTDTVLLTLRYKKTVESYHDRIEYVIRDSSSGDVCNGFIFLARNACLTCTHALISVRAHVKWSWLKLRKNEFEFAFKSVDDYIRHKGGLYEKSKQQIERYPG